MAINRSALRRGSAKDLLAKVKEASNTKSNQGGGGKDERFWQPTVDQSGNGFAVLRFLPSKTEDSLPFVKLYNHGFKVGAKWLIEDCPTTHGGQCPVCDANSELWNSGFDKDKETVRERKRRLRYVSNVMVIKDPKNPENEGKIFLYSFGAKIFDKLTTAMNPPEEYGEEPRDPFGFFEGCTVKLKIKNKDGYRNYDDSTVDPASDLFDGDEDELMAVLEKMYDLGDFVNPSNFKSYDEIKKRLDDMLGNSRPVIEEEDVPSFNATEYGSEAKEEKPKKKEAPKDESSSDDDEDEDLAFFKGLMED